MEPARIRIQRHHAVWADRARAYKVAVDGEVVVSIRNGEEKVVEVAPGRHEVRVRIDWASGEPMEVDLEPGGEVQLSCRGRNPLLALYWATVGRNHYVVLERTDV